jgi:hypothetical protein
MAAQPDPASLAQTATTPGKQQTEAQQERTQPPVNRRRALRLLGTLAVAAAGAAALTATRPEPASAANPPTIFASTTSTPAVEGDNSGGGPGLLGDITGTPPSSFISIGVWGRSNSATAPGVEGDNTASPLTGFPAVGVAGYSPSGVGVFGSSHPPAELPVGPPTGDTVGVWGFTRTSAAGVAGSNDATANGGPGVWGDSLLGIGVQGFSRTSAAGVEGDNAGSGPGVLGVNISSSLPFGGPGGIGVQGTSSYSGFAGVEGDNSSSGPALLGNNTGGGAAVVGMNSSGAGGHPAISAVNAGPGGPGAVGYANGTSSIGTGGVSDTGYGLYGSATGSGTGVLGASGGNAAVWGAASAAGAYSGLFTGGKGLIVYGALTVAGGPKSAAVKAADGTLRRLYSVESPESWFEDFGSGQLTGGSATIQLEPGFAGIVKADHYHVFLTPDGETQMLHVTNKTSQSFVVREGHGGASNVTFSYRVVAKRKDIEGARLEQVEEPSIPALPKLHEPPPIPSTPAMPPLPTPRGHGG